MFQKSYAPITLDNGKTPAMALSAPGLLMTKREPSTCFLVSSILKSISCDILTTPSTSALAAALALVFLAGVASRLAVVLAVAVVAFVRVGGKPVAGVGPGGVDGCGRARGDGECAAGAVFGAGGGGNDGRRGRRANPTGQRGRSPRPTLRRAR